MADTKANIDSNRDRIVRYRGKGSGARRWYVLPLALLCTATIFAILPFSEIFMASPEKNLAVRSVETTAPPIEPPKLKKRVVPEMDSPRHKSRQTFTKPQPRLKMPQKQEARQKPDLQPSYEEKPLKLNRKMSLDFEVSAPSGSSGPRTDSVGKPVAETAQNDSKGSAGESGPYSLGEVDRQPTSLVRSEPLYPYRARSRGIEGSVKVRFVVTASGKVKNIRILQSRPEGIFEEPVKDAVSKWEFQPATRNGKPIAATVTTTVTFALE